MIELAYTLSASQHTGDAATAGAMELRYDWFVGDVRFIIGGVDLSAAYGWVPILDFALCLRLVTVELRTAVRASFDLTESAAGYRFDRSGAAVRITFDMTDAVASTTRSELETAAAAFLSTTLSELEASTPGLSANATIAAWRADLL